MDLQVPVSLGELMDKYSILEIKQRYISDPEKVVHVKKEMESLDPQAQHYLKEMPHYYRYLVHINETIWNLSDEIRAHPDPQKCMEIITHNDRRFRVKNKINRFSLIKEQKSYPKTSCVFVGHFSIGDCFTNSGIVRYLSTCYDEVIIHVPNLGERITKALYADDDTIKVVLDIRIHYSPHLGYLKEALEREYSGSKVYMVGTFLDSNWAYGNYSTFYDYFYSCLGIPKEYRFIYGYVPKIPSLSVDSPYIFVHQRHHHIISSSYPVIYADPEKFILDYVEIVENAEELHLDDSSFFCMANYLDLSKVKKLILHKTFSGDYDVMGYCKKSQNWILQ